MMLVIELIYLMAKRRAKKVVKQPSNVEEEKEEPEIKEQEPQFKDLEVERRITTIQAVRDAEIQNLLIGVRLLRSTFNEEQLKTPALQFFKENMPNLTVKTGGEDGHFEMGWKGEDGNMPNSYADERDFNISLLHKMYMANPQCGSAIPDFNLSGQTNLLGASNVQLPDFLMEEPTNSQMHGLPDAFQTPGTSTQRLSVGMTPKTLRLPKNGEMLLSVRGSPLGMYKEDNMEAIHESDED